MGHDRIKTFSLEKTHDQITPFVVDVDHVVMMKNSNFRNDDDDYENHRMDLFQNLKYKND
jgi:hypothetical protein